jgi:multicomponent Na+:H+ antiporter subunit E
MIRYLAVGGWLTAAWAALWGEFSAANILSGIVVATVLLLVFRLEPVVEAGRFRPLRALRFIGYFLVQLVIANAQVAWEVVTPRNRDNEGIVALPVVACSQALLTTLVNTIGLTPGTMVIDLTESPRVIYVHVLHLDDIDQARAVLMRFQELAVRAFGSERAIDELATLTLTPGGDR